MSRTRDVRRWTAAALGIISVPLVLVGLGAYWVASQLSGCDVDLAATVRDLGVRPGPGGTVAVVDPPCASHEVRELVVRDPGGRVVWRAVATAPAGRSLPGFTLGRAPTGYRDVVALAGPLDPATSYAVEVHYLDAGGAGEPGSTLPTDLALVLGGRAAFRPGDLAPGRIWFQGRSLTPAAFERRACAPGRTTSAPASPPP